MQQFFLRIKIALKMLINICFILRMAFNYLQKVCLQLCSSNLWLFFFLLSKNCFFMHRSVRSYWHFTIINLIYTFFQFAYLLSGAIVAKVSKTQFLFPVHYMPCHYPYHLLNVGIPRVGVAIVAIITSISQNTVHVCRYWIYCIKIGG